jgi:hypothetical protein
MRSSLSVIIAMCSTIAWGQAEEGSASGGFVSAQDFREKVESKLGRAKNNNAIEINYNPSNYFGYTAYSVSLNRVVGDGAGEVLFPFTYNQVKEADQFRAEPGGAVLEASNQKYLIYGAGLKYRTFSNQIEEGLFYGGGLKFYHFVWNYTKNKASGPEDYSRGFQAFAPQFDLGYLLAMGKSSQLVFGLEAGGVLNTFDRTEVGSEKNIFSKPGLVNNAYVAGNIGLRFGY